MLFVHAIGWYYSFIKILAFLAAVSLATHAYIHMAMIVHNVTPEEIMRPLGCDYLIETGVSRQGFVVN